MQARELGFGEGGEVGALAWLGQFGGLAPDEGGGGRLVQALAHDVSHDLLQPVAEEENQKSA